MYWKDVASLLSFFPGEGFLLWKNDFSLVLSVELIGLEVV